MDQDERTRRIEDWAAGRDAPLRRASPGSNERRAARKGVAKRRKAERRGRRIVAIAAVFLVGAGALLLALRLTRTGVLPGVHVAGVDVGTMSRSELEDRLAELGEDISDVPIVLKREGGGAPARSFNSDGAATGFGLDIDRTGIAAFERGRQLNPLAALADQLRAVFVDTDVEAYLSADERKLAEWIAVATDALSDPAQEGDLAFSGIDVEPVYPEPGVGVDEGAVRAAAQTALLGGEREPIILRAIPLLPLTDNSDVDAVAETALFALSAPVTLTHGDIQLTIPPEELAKLLDVEVQGTDDATLALIVNPRRLSAALGDSLADLETQPVDATFSVSGGEVTVVPSQPGFVFDPKRTAAQIVKLATGKGDRTAELDGKKVQPEFTTKQAKALGVTEQVSTFTTYHSCCEPRVENIHLAADIIDGSIVAPGETFSLNEAIGKRTAERGFVGAPAISDGEFVEEIGGGISQLATTTFNAIFFGGYDFLEYKAHSYYISRYPVGREATISTPSPDLEFLNDSDHGIFIDTYHTDTSITVSFYGTQDIDVTTTTGARENVAKPEVECEVNKDLGKDEEVVVQEGLEGFDIVVDRILTPPDGDEVVEPFSTHYLSMPRIVQRQSCREDGKRGGRGEDGGGNNDPGDGGGNS